MFFVFTHFKVVHRIGLEFVQVTVGFLKDIETNKVHTQIVQVIQNTQN